MWDETATELTNSSAKSLLDGLNEDGDDAPVLPHALTNLLNTKHVFEVKSQMYYNYEELKSHTFAISELREVGEASNVYTLEDGDEIHKSLMKRLLRGPKMCAPSISSEPKKEKVIEQATDEKLGRTVTRMALQRLFRHSRHYHGTYSQDFTHTELEDGGDRRTSDNEYLTTLPAATYND
ncbi:hypothetical protein Tco_0399624 [Tanacetum coccineum]